MSASLDLALHPSAQDVLRKPFATSKLARDCLEAFRESVSHGEDAVQSQESLYHLLPLLQKILKR
jgi:hypothetical protein